MWPSDRDLFSHTIIGERIIEDMTMTALTAWEPVALAAALPSLTAAGELPPNPEALETEAADAWDEHAERYIVGAAIALWAVNVADGYRHFGRELPEPDNDDRPDAAVVRAVSEHAEVDEVEVRTAWAATQTPELEHSRAEAIALARTETRGVPAVIRAKLSAELERGPNPTPDELRSTTRAALSPGGVVLRSTARQTGYQAAGVMNHAVLSAARANAFGDPLDKTWIATIDSRTRRSHWAADGQRVPVDSSFTVGGASLDYPGDPKGPARETKRCRCRVGVLDVDDDLPEDNDRHTERLDGGDSTARNREGSQDDEKARRAEDGNVRARDDPDGLGRVASATPTLTDDTEHEEFDMAKPNSTAPEDNGEMFRTFTDAVIAVVGEPTSDGRMLDAEIDLSLRNFPLPLMWTKQSSQGHLDAYTVGVIETASVSGGKVIASGYLLNTTESDEAASQIAHGVTGPSVDLADTEWKLTDENGKEITEEEWWDLPIDAKVFQTVTKAELIGTTLVSTPAFGQTGISLNAEREVRAVALVASAAEEFRPRVYKAELFEDPKLTGPTLPTMGDDGRIYGHLACFGECHRSIQSECIIAPRSASEYRHFHTSPAVRLDDGRRLPVGRLTVGTGHAPDRVSGAQAAAHYDNTGTAFALVRVGEDAHGVWFSGVAAPGATAEQIEMGITAPLSGDWRDFGSGLELVAALAVNTPGFIARGHDDEAGRPIALVASIGPDPRRTERQSLTADSVAAIVKATVAEMKADAERAELAAAAAPLLERAREVTAEAEADELASLLARAEA